MNYCIHILIPYDRPNRTDNRKRENVKTAWTYILCKYAAAAARSYMIERTPYSMRVCAQYQTIICAIYPYMCCESYLRVLHIGKNNHIIPDSPVMVRQIFLMVLNSCYKFVYRNRRNYPSCMRWKSTFFRDD